MKQASLFALLVAAPLARASFDISFTLTSNSRLENTLVAYHSTASSDEGAAYVGAYDPGTYSFTETLPGQRSDYEGYRYSLVATYIDAGGTTGLVIGLSPDAARAAQGQSFAGIFGTSTSEATVVRWVKGSASGDWFDAYRLRGFFLDHLSLLPLGESGGSLVGFSNGTKIGRLTINPVPEPSALVALGFGVVILKRRRHQ